MASGVQGFGHDEVAPDRELEHAPEHRVGVVDCLRFVRLGEVVNPRLDVAGGDAIDADRLPARLDLLAAARQEIAVHLGYGSAVSRFVDT